MADDAPTPFDQIEPEAQESPPEPAGAPLRSPAISFDIAAPLPAPCAVEPASETAQDDEEDQSSDPAEAEDDLEPSAMPSGGGGWTIPMICIGIAMIACCILIPATEENRRLVFEREHLRADLEQITRQIEVNDEFLKRVADDPSLSERLAQRQMKMVRQGTSILELKGESTGTRDMSPYELTTLAPPPDTPAYHPRGGVLGSIISNPRSQLYVMGSGMLFVAAGLVLGATPTRR